MWLLGIANQQVMGMAVRPVDGEGKVVIRHAHHTCASLLIGQNLLGLIRVQLAHIPFSR